MAGKVGKDISWKKVRQRISITDLLQQKANRELRERYLPYMVYVYVVVVCVQAKRNFII